MNGTKTMEQLKKIERRAIRIRRLIIITTIMNLVLRYFVPIPVSIVMGIVAFLIALGAIPILLWELKKVDEILKEESVD